MDDEAMFGPQEDYVAELRKDNQQRLDHLADDGWTFSPIDQLHERLDLLTKATIGGLAALAGRDPAELEAGLEQEWEEGCAQRITDLEAQRNRHKLAVSNGGEQLTFTDGMPPTDWT